MPNNPAPSLRKWGYAYSAASLLVFLPVLLMLMFGGIFAYDNPSGARVYIAHAIFFSLLASPFVLIAANIFAWKAINRGDEGKVVGWMIAPGVYLGAVFCIVALASLVYKAATLPQPSKSISEAVASGDMDAVKRFIMQGSSLTAAEATEALFIVADGKDPEIVSLLLANGAQADKVRYGRTPLNEAARGGNPEIVKMILSAGANADQADGATSALRAAAAAGNLEVMAVLLEHSASVSQRRSGGDAALLAALAGDYAPFDDRANNYNRYQSPEFRATWKDRVQEQCIREVELLLKHKADINARNDDGETALYWARKREWPAVEAYLLKNGARD